MGRDGFQKGGGKWRGRGGGSRWRGHRDRNGHKQQGGGPSHQSKKFLEENSKNKSGQLMHEESSNSFKSSRKEFTYSQFIPEKDLGITEFIMKDKRITGILKERYTDFIVHEIDLEGNTVKLTSLDVPIETETVECSSMDSTIIPSEKWQELIKLLKKETTGGPKEVTLEVSDMDKETRRSMHESIKKAFGRKLQSNTADRAGKKFIIIKKSNGSDNRGNWTRGKNNEYLHFVVHKHDMDTTETVNQISYRLRFKPSNLNFAGTKDKRACTSQRMSLWHGEPKRFCNLKLRNIWIGNYEFKNRPMQLGQLKGNMFTIALRDISGSEEDINTIMTSLRERGFVNYFGTQRFGTNKDAPTHAVGKALLHGDWEKAVNLILLPRGDQCFLLDALNCWQKEKDGKKAFSLIKGSRSSIEASLLKGLAEAGKNDYLKALNQLPRNLRLLYLHAYQSFVWNRVTSRRIQEFGFKTLPGDLVLIDDSASEENELVEDIAVADNNIKMESCDEGNGKKSHQDATDEASPKKESDKSEPREKDEQNKELDAKVRIITAEEAEKTPPEKIVLPTPGFKAVLPDNVLKKWYVEILAEDGLTIESLRQKSKEYSVGGSYRHFVGKPSQLEWKVLRYKEAHASLLRTDSEELQGKPEPQDDPEGSFRALIVKFGLDTCMYATIALREVVDYRDVHRKKENECLEIDDKVPGSTKAADETGESVKATDEPLKSKEFAKQSSLTVRVFRDAADTAKVTDGTLESTEVKKDTSEGLRTPAETTEHGTEGQMETFEGSPVKTESAKDEEGALTEGEETAPKTTGSPVESNEGKKETSKCIRPPTETTEHAGDKKGIGIWGNMNVEENGNIVAKRTAGSLVKQGPPPKKVKADLPQESNEELTESCAYKTS